MEKEKQSKWLHVWLMPVLWLPCAVMSAQFRGDCGMAFHFATLPGGWLPLVLGFHAHERWIVTRLVGSLLVVVLGGAIMDFLRVDKKVYAVCASLAVLSVLATFLPRFRPTDVFSLFCLIIYLVGPLSILAALGRQTSEEDQVQPRGGG